MRMYPSILEDGVFDEWGQADRVGEALTNVGNRVVNNFFGAAAGDNTCALDTPSDLQGVIDLDIHDNVFFNGGDALPECGEGLSSITGYSAGETLAADPDLTNDGSFPDTAADVTPRNNSALVGAAVADDAAVPYDFAGNVRADPPSIGALEP